jgi:RNA polymerase sigma-70 factor (ECF subfamily)
VSFLRDRDPLAEPEALIERVYLYVSYRLGDGPDAEDVTSEVFERALRYRRSFDPRKGPFLAWLFGIARRLIAETAARPVAAASEFDAVAPGDLADDTARRLTLAAAVATLPERDRDLLALRYGADLTARQIGEVLEIGTHAAEVALGRALERVRAKLADETDQGLLRSTGL